MTYLDRLFSALPWFRLVPDTEHRIVTGGYGRFSAGGNVASSDYVATAATTDGTVALSYLPVGGSLLIDPSRLSKRVRGRWFDPTDGVFVRAAMSRVPGSRQVRVTAPKTNAAGDSDWVLVLAGPDSPS